MNKNVLLATVAATALVVGASLASAQTMNTEQPKASAPMKSDSEKAGLSAQSPTPQTTGQAPRDGQQPQAQPGAQPGQSGTQSGTQGQAGEQPQAKPGAQPGQSGTQSGTQGQTGR